MLSKGLVAQALEPLFAEMRVSLLGFQTSLRKQMAPFHEFLEELGANERLYNRVYEAGWMPHHSTPFEEIADDYDASRIRELLRAHYAADWDQVRATFEAELEQYNLDEEAKACFREALDAHEARRYRAPPKLLFPEIERVVREELFAGSVTQALTSQRDLRAASGTLQPWELRKNAVGGLVLFRKFEGHLYSRVETPAQIAAAQADPVPNRHAAIHGLVIYSSMQSSLNALIMTDFAFSVVNALKVRGEDWRKF